MLNIVDDVTREFLAAIPDTSISGRRVARELTRNSPRILSLPGPRITRSSGITSRRESPFKTAMSRASTDECVTNCSTRVCSSASIMPEAPLLNGQRIIIISGRTHRSVIRPRQATPASSPQPAPTLPKMKELRVSAGCYHRANWRTQNCRGSSRRWVKVSWQVRVARTGRDSLKLALFAYGQWQAFNYLRTKRKKDFFPSVIRDDSHHILCLFRVRHL